MNHLAREVLKPLLYRLGSAFGVFVASADYFSDAEVATIQTALVLVGGYVVDLLMQKVIR